MDNPKLYASALAAVIAYFILIFVGEIVNLSKMMRLVTAIVVGILYYRYGETVGAFIKNIFGTLGL